MSAPPFGFHILHPDACSDASSWIISSRSEPCGRLCGLWRMKWRHEWAVRLVDDIEEFKVELIHSKICGLKEIRVDGHLLLSTRKRVLSFSWTHAPTLEVFHLCSDRDVHTLTPGKVKQLSCPLYRALAPTLLQDAAVAKAHEGEIKLEEWPESDCDDEPEDLDSYKVQKGVDGSWVAFADIVGAEPTPEESDYEDSSVDEVSIPELLNDNVSSLSTSASVASLSSLPSCLACEGK